MRFNRKVNWKCIQVKDWTKICVRDMVISNVIYDLWVSFKDYIVNKYGIYMKSVYLTWKTWDVKERRNENVSKYKIEQSLCSWQ